MFESHTDWDPANTTVPTTLVTAAQLVNSRAIIQQLWPQFDFTKDRDFNGTAGTQTGAAGTVILSPSECLVLFLGGTFKNSGTATSPLFSMIGFSKDPTDPFATVAGSPREAPLFEFQTNRLSDVNNNGIPEYKDNLPGQTMPYLYYSSYDGAGYNEASTWEFATGSKFVLATPYWQGADESTPRWKPNSHQIISPGFDGVYGYGGPFTGSGANAFPTATGTAPTGAQAAPTDAQRVNEADNITNFSKGAMQP